MTPRERAHGLTWDGKFWQKPAHQMEQDIEQAIAAAVAEEREKGDKRVAEEREDCAKICDENAKANRESFEHWKSVASNPDDMGVLKFAAWAGQAERDAAAIRARGKKR